jgi:hypothetical protein
MGGTFRVIITGKNWVGELRTTDDRNCHTLNSRQPEMWNCAGVHHRDRRRRSRYFPLCAPVPIERSADGVNSASRYIKTEGDGAHRLFAADSFDME